MIVSDYDQEILQSQTNPWHCKEDVNILPLFMSTLDGRLVDS